MTVVSDQIQSDLNKISEFKRGYASYLESMNTLIVGIISFLGSASLTEVTKKDLVPIRRLVDAELQALSQKTKKLIMEVDSKHLEPIARKDFYSLFPNIDVDSLRIEFIVLFKTFEHFRNYYIESDAAWKSIRSTIHTSNFVDKSFQMDTLIGYRINPGIEKLECLRVMLLRMAVLLEIPFPAKIFERKENNPNFNPNSTYRLSSLFQINLGEGEAGKVHDFDLSSDSNNPSSSSPAQKFQSKSNFDKVVVDAPNVLNAGGKYPWNSNSHYYMRYEEPQYLEERALYSQTIKIDTHIGAEESKLKSELIRSLSSKEHKSKTKDDIEREYSEFMMHFFQFCSDITMMNINMPSNMKILFLFHLGPPHFYMLAKKFLLEANTGYLHVRSADGKKVTRILPVETVKKNVIDFWKQIVLPGVGEEKNNLVLLKKITEKVETRYKEISLLAIKQYDMLPAAVKLQKSRTTIFREKMNEWMGATNIIVFKRFMKNEYV